MSIDFHIRPAIADDAEAISALMFRSYGELLRPAYNPRILAKALPRISKANPTLLGCGTYYVAQADCGALIGAGGWTDVSPTRGLANSGVGHMRHVAVDPTYLRLGVGRSIARAAFHSASASGVYALRCMSTLTAEAFYQSLGFTSLQPIELTLEPGLFFPAIEMRMTL